MSLRVKILLGCLAGAVGLGALQIAQCSRSKERAKTIATHVDLRRAEARVERPAVTAKARAEVQERTQELEQEVREAVRPEVTHDLVDLADSINAVLGLER